jgi:hypothetical protein
MKLRPSANLHLKFVVLLLSCLQWSCSKPVSAVPGTPQLMVLPAISFSQSSESVECYDFVEVTIDVASPSAQNPFTEVFVTGRFGPAGRLENLAADGFCDSPTGVFFAFVSRQQNQAITLIRAPTGRAISKRSTPAHSRRLMPIAATLYR